MMKMTMPMTMEVYKRETSTDKQEKNVEYRYSAELLIRGVFGANESINGGKSVEMYNIDMFIHK